MSSRARSTSLTRDPLRLYGVSLTPMQKARGTQEGGLHRQGPARTVLSPPNCTLVVFSKYLKPYKGGARSEAQASEVSTVRIERRGRIFEILNSRKMASVYVRVSRGWLCG
eukprot:scaffold34178_cov69-Phaeocystis_antarctica.AAC.1